MKSISRVGGTIHTSKPIRMRNNGDVPPTNQCLSPLVRVSRDGPAHWGNIPQPEPTTHKSTYLLAGHIL